MLSTTLKTFSDPEKLVQYTRGAVTVALDKAVFDANYVAVDPETGASVISKNPTIGAALADLPEGEARNGDIVTITEGGVDRVWKVADYQPDSEGHVRLILRK